MTDEKKTLSLTQRKVLEALLAGTTPHYDGPHNKTLSVLLTQGWVRRFAPASSTFVITDAGREVLTWPPVMWRKP